MAMSNLVVQTHTCCSESIESPLELPWYNSKLGISTPDWAGGQVLGPFQEVVTNYGRGGGGGGYKTGGGGPSKVVSLQKKGGWQKKF